MKNILKLGGIAGLLIVASCSATKRMDHSSRDGSSFEKALIVKSVAEEYEYIRKVCPDCELLSQALVEKEKPYDVLQLKKPDGEEVSYYFDISKFYGKSLFGKRF